MIINNIAEIKELHLENEYRERALEAAFAIKQEVEKFLPCTMEINPENDNQISLWLDVEAKIQISKNYKGEFHVFGKEANISWSQKEEIKKTLAEPKGFKVLTLKNLVNWITYTKELQRRCMFKAQENAVEIGEFMSKVDAMQKAGCKLVLSESGLHGWLESKNFTLSFTCDQQSGYTSQDLRLNDGTKIETMAKIENIKL